MYEQTTPTTDLEHPHEEQEAGRPCACIEGWVFIGVTAEAEDGEIEERVVRYACARCA